MQKKAEATRPGDGQKKRFAGRAPLAEMDMHADPEKTGRYSLRAISDAVVEQALEGGLTKEKAADIRSALPKKA